MARRSKCRGWILAERGNVTGPFGGVRAVDRLAAVMLHLRFGDGPEMTGEDLADETSELLLLARCELVPEGRACRR
jgi:hypothetical protein